MKKIRNDFFQKLAGLSAIVLFLVLCFTSLPAVAVEDAILAIVNDDIITLKDFQDYVHSFYVQLKMEGRSEKEITAVMSELEQDGIKKLIEERLILSEANRIGLEVRAEIVDERLSEIKRSYKSEQKFIDALVANGATVSDLKKKLNDNFKIKYMIEEKVKSKIVVNPQEVTEYYKLHFEKFQVPESREVQSIYISAKPDKETARLSAQNLLAELKAGADFAEKAKQHSEGPDIGTVTRGQLRPEIENEIFKVSVGNISNVIESEQGFYIFKILENQPATIATLEEVKSTISQTIFQTKFQERFLKWIDELKKTAFIDIKK